ncbi:MAG: hypothetical protein Ta2B_20220 [Termitinemataceae bacterium]|nr:MAG: hypothetical protein Ta2B_20220 [Termitinemataceae bacterium]
MRIEIIANHSVEENIFDEFAVEGVAKYYTKLNSAHGVGKCGPRQGDAIWPEENFVLVIWCEEQEALGIERALKRVKGRFPGEGIKLFGLHEVSSNTALLTGKVTPLLSYAQDSSNGNELERQLKSNAEEVTIIDGVVSNVLEASTPPVKLSDSLGLKI